MSISHTYGPTCAFAPSTDPHESNSEGYIPPLNVQFFYTSPLPIDDPLSAVPSDSKSAKHPPRPFSNYDNKALEEAWQGLIPKSQKTSLRRDKPKKIPSQSQTIPQGSQKDGANDQKPHSSEESKAKNHRIYPPTSNLMYDPPGLFVVEDEDEDDTLGLDIDRSETLKNPRNSRAANRRGSQERQDDHEVSNAEILNSKTGRTSSLPCCEDMEENDSAEPEICIACQQAGPSQNVVQESFETMDESCQDCLGAAQEDGADERSNAGLKGRSRAFFKARTSDNTGLNRLNDSSEPLDNGELSSSVSNPHSILDNGKLSSSAASSYPILDNGTTGSPFLKLSSRPNNPLHQANDCELDQDHERETSEAEAVTSLVHTCKARKKHKQAEVPVGISRLHLVKLPELLMHPIYWSPVNDIACVTRATWFYKDTMYPVEPAVANQLEYGYRELRPWSQTWKDELNSAVEVGAAGEEKIAHPLWPKDGPPKGKQQKKSPCTLPTGPQCAMHCFYGEAAAEGSLNSEISEKSPETKIVTKRYANGQVIYENATKAYILKPNLQPSAYYGRKPLQKIRKGIPVGIPVLRGFDGDAFEKLHPSKNLPTRLESTIPVSGDANVNKGDFCPACKAREKQQKITDLVLVIHGIGQKLSERVESFNFTLAINQFRRALNVESNQVQWILRPSFKPMVLPINWRSTLSFDEGGLDPSKNVQKLDYSLSDVTQESLPTIRNLISEVVLDIPLYLSHHKPKMIQAVVQEANRVYRLWCKNNPGFEKEGRIHIIAHSLGSAMALDILSRQPTSIPKLNLSEKKIQGKFFEFKTTNLFFVGSPAGFFLLLDQAKLLPRRHQGKPDSELADDADKKITGERGMFGCMAIDNIYNIMHYNDPIAYLLGPTVDKNYVSSLKDAKVPSASTSFFGSIENAVRGVIPGVSATSSVPIGQIPKPVGVARLPSQLEMEVHDFTSEEMAEKKFYLLNDNGQIDWYLNIGRGPLEFQYLNMLSAHSSYWLSPDFIRFVVVEIGRQAGKRHTLPNMKACKNTRK